MPRFPSLDLATSSAGRQNTIQKTQKIQEGIPYAGLPAHSIRHKSSTLKKDRLAAVKKYFTVTVYLYTGELNDPKHQTYTNWKVLSPQRIQLPEDCEFETMDEFIIILTEQIDTWPKIFAEIKKPIELFIASKFYPKHGPIHLASSVWKNFLESLLQNNFHCSSASGRTQTWNIPLCIRMHDHPNSELDTSLSPPPKTTKRKHKSKESKLQIKKEREQLIVKQEQLLTAKRKRLNEQSTNCVGIELALEVSRKRSLFDFYADELKEQEEKWKKQQEEKDQMIQALLAQIKKLEKLQKQNEASNEMAMESVIEEVDETNTEENRLLDQGMSLMGLLEGYDIVVSDEFDCCIVLDLIVSLVFSD
ncbi:hypothetical protein VTO42DRAFT_3970 [Malbranchea cinnamomea]